MQPFLKKILDLQIFRQVLTVNCYRKLILAHQYCFSVTCFGLNFIL